jgi:DNA-binding IclR family transcriptional regulator
MPVRSASRALNVFEAFGSEGRPLLLAELASLIDVPLSSCHGLVSTLLEIGYLYAPNRRRGFYPTRKLYNLAQAIAAKDPYLQRLSPYLESLREAVHETIIVGTRQGDSVLYLEVLEGPQTIRYSARPGEFKPLHSSSIGKALLAHGGTAVRQRLQDIALPPITPNTITGRERLLQDIEEGAARGYFVTHGENVVDVTALATSVDVDGTVLGIAVAGPSYRMEANIPAMATQLLATCAEIERKTR